MDFVNKDGSTRFPLVLDAFFLFHSKMRNLTRSVLPPADSVSCFFITIQFEISSALSSHEAAAVLLMCGFV